MYLSRIKLSLTPKKNAERHSFFGRGFNFFYSAGHVCPLPPNIRASKICPHRLQGAVKLC